jgi:hypothetical protein
VAVRYFTPDEANELLHAVKPFAERMVAHRQALLAAQAEHAALMQAVSGNGGLRPGELAGAESRVEREATALARCAEAIQELGAVVKDLERGLIDFPARRGDEEVYLCWRVGEGEIGFWHPVDEGFAGRRPLPL